MVSRGERVVSSSWLYEERKTLSSRPFRRKEVEENGDRYGLQETRSRLGSSPSYTSESTLGGKRSHSLLVSPIRKFKPTGIPYTHKDRQTHGDTQKHEYVTNDFLLIDT